MLGYCFIKFRNIIINSVVSNSEGAVFSRRPSKLWGCVCVCGWGDGEIAVLTNYRTFAQLFLDCEHIFDLLTLTSHDVYSVVIFSLKINVNLRLTVFL